MHGLGNDYIYIDCMDGSFGGADSSIIGDDARLAEISRKLSDRHCGIGGDGIIMILPSDSSDFRMRMFNADGSEAQMCGNASRCIGKYVYDNGYTQKCDITLETLSGVKYLYLHVNDATGKVDEVTVDMGPASFDCKAIGVDYGLAEMIDAPVSTALGVKKITGVSMGNPHGVIFMDSLDGLDIDTIGPELELNPMWHDRANIEFAEVIDRHTIRMRVWERGSGETQACGTGACATAVAAIRTGRADSPVTVKLSGGNLTVSVDQTTGHVMMRGGATEVFNGIYCPC